MELTKEIDSLEELGMSDPLSYKDSMKASYQCIRRLDFYQDVYPQGEVPELPKAIFLPSKQIMRVMIKALLKYASHEPPEKFLLRFGLFNDPKCLS